MLNIFKDHIAAHASDIGGYYTVNMSFINQVKNLLCVGWNSMRSMSFSRDTKQEMKFFPC